MNANTNPFWLADKQIPIELTRAYKEAVRDKTATYAVSRVVVALHRLIDEAAFHSELQNAVHNSLTSGSNVAELLREREIGILAEIEAVEADRRLYQGKCFARQVEVQPILNQCAIENGRLHDEITTLQSRISRFEKDRKEAKEKYQSAGLSESQIAQIGILPSLENLENWKGQLAEKLARVEQIARFYQSSPDYDTSLLEVTAAAQAV